MRLSMRSSWILAALVFVALPVRAEETATAQKIGHGQEITAKNVGPSAAGYQTLKTYAGAAMKDGKIYPFAQEISTSASYDGVTIEGPHLLIEAAAFLSSLDIYMAKTVVLRGVSVRPTTHSHIALLVRPGAGDVYVLWSDIGAGGANAVGAGIALRGARALVYRSHVSKAADGISISASGVRIEESLIETRTASPGDHNDAIQVLGAPEHITIARNKILNPNPQTSCLYLLGRHIDVRGNYLSGGGWTIYGGAQNNGHGKGSASDVSVTDTVFGREYSAKSGHFGPVSYWDRTYNWRDNRFSDGKPVSP